MQIVDRKSPGACEPGLREYAPALATRSFIRSDLRSSHLSYYQPDESGYYERRFTTTVVVYAESIRWSASP